ncbi:zinc finger MYM-type protein 1-like [Camellia sinensis]|uniref:zinc finger MYM-type protein 1-like n=1 Tax=Camellia sinensis TaxID=4442 RepID=UPI001035AC25|nr:zinc finger MYM-type protein 1-like [Camellia sinensis]
MKLITPEIQKDIANCAACETTNAIIEDIENQFFAILVDESRDVSTKEQMAVVLRYVDKRGIITERFLGLIHVADTTVLSLKAAIESMFSKLGLSLSRIRGQGYDGTSNMQAVAKNHIDIASLFNLVSNVLNVVGASCKRQDLLRETQAAKVAESLSNDEIQSGQGMNKEIGLKRAGDTRWGSHCGTLLNLIALFASVIRVLEVVEEDGSYSEQRADARTFICALESFDCSFNLHLMKNVLSITNELSQALQRKDHDIVNAMSLVKVCKQRLQTMQDEGWESLLTEISLFCKKRDIPISNMHDICILPRRSRRRAPQITNLHHYCIELFYTVLDMQLQELNSRFA